VGRYGVVTGGVDDSSCIDCPTGTYQDYSGENKCKECPQGTYNADVKMDALVDCIDCAKGTYADVLGMQSCTPCPSGRYGDEMSLQFRMATILVSPTLVTYSEADLNERARLKERDCKGCAAGKSFVQGTGNIPATASTECVTCDAGKYSTIGTSTCFDCPQGWYRDTNQDGGQCYACPLGTYGVKSVAVTVTDGCK